MLPDPLGKLEKVKKRVKKTVACVKVKYLWAILIARVYEVMPLVCPNCGGEMRIIAFIKDRSVITHILDHIGEPSEAPTLSSARGPPVDESIEQLDLFSEQLDDIPDDEMNQTVSW